MMLLLRRNGSVSHGCQTLSRHVICECWHVVNPSRVDPGIIELEERTDSYRIVERLIRPAGCLRSIDIALVDKIRL